MGMLTNKSTGEKFIPKAKTGKTIEEANKAKSVSQSFEKGRNEPLTMQEFRKVLKDRNISEDDLATLKDQEVGNAKLISLHPENEQLDNVILKGDAPHLYDENKLNKDEELRQEQKQRVRDAR